jgi:pyridoxine 4-dehydrogenase
MLPVQSIGLGAMRLTGFPHRLPRTEAVALARRAVERGVRFFDTADAYDLGDNEALLAEALHPYAEEVVIATKGGRINLGRDWYDLGRPEYLRQACELSLKRLRLERIHLYQLHRIDPTVAPADQIGALKRLRDEGKVRDIGLSEVTVAQLEAARAIAPIASVQNRFNYADQTHRAVLDYCTAHGIAFIPYAPLGGSAALQPVADRLGITANQAALAWLLQLSPMMLPIPGTGSAAHLDENLAAAAITAHDLAAAMTG